MRGDATTAQMFGEIFRNIFGWSVTRSSALPERIYDELYELYVLDKEHLRIEEYFEKTNPAALQEMTATMLESARKGYWKPSPAQLKDVASMNARITEKHGAPCTEFICANKELQEFTASNLDGKSAARYKTDMAKATALSADSRVLKEENILLLPDSRQSKVSLTVIAVIAVCLILVTAAVVFRKRRKR